MLVRPKPLVAKTENAASSSRARVSARRRVTRTGDPSGRTVARRACWAGVCIPPTLPHSDTLTNLIRLCIVARRRRTETAMTDPQTPPEPAKPEQRFLAELFDAITERTFFLVIGVLVIQMAFVLSYVGAFHQDRKSVV